MSPADRLTGVFVSLVTPFEDEAPRLDWLSENMDALNRTSIRGYLALGGNGEAQTLTESERVHVLDAILARKGSKIVIAGVSEESSRAAIGTARLYASRGADYLRVMPPHYFSKHMNDEVLVRFYREVADESPVPLLLYNVPKLTGGVRLSPETAAVLARHPNILGVKDSSPEGIYGYLAAVREIPGFRVLAGSAGIFFPALVAGASGGDMSLANFLPGPCCELYDAFRSGDLDRARSLHHRLFTVNAAVSGTYGVAGVKAAMDLTGYRGGEPRKPLSALTMPQRNSLRSVLAEEGYLA